MKFLSLLKNNDARRSSSASWAWPSCHQAKTLSFRENIIINNNNNKNDVVFKAINSAALVEESPESFFTESPNSASFSTASEEWEPIETVIRGLRSDRLFFEPDETSSLLDSKLASGTFYVPFKDSVLMSMESKNPYVDFKSSMEEMVETHGVKDWESLEELLCWYLKVNGKSNHGYIVRAFVDLLTGLAVDTSASSSSCSCSHSPLSGCSSSLSSSCCTRCVSCLEGEDEIVEEGLCSSLLLAQIKEDVTPKDKASSSSSKA
ncbi:transcription repressor OFP13-like [Abrus precatorius]|uniref:Transcription repressor n=1 Tax=Abrus precatorius TaxID=3816 RepID=A0A8B8MFK7_ABRPR|nr:transcription repressor OFP13-like [Abrus precatorius]